MGFLEEPVDVNGKEYEQRVIEHSEVDEELNRNLTGLGGSAHRATIVGQCNVRVEQRWLRYVVHDDGGIRTRGKAGVGGGTDPDGHEHQVILCGCFDIDRVVIVSSEVSERSALSDGVEPKALEIHNLFISELTREDALVEGPYVSQCAIQGILYQYKIQSVLNSAAIGAIYGRCINVDAALSDPSNVEQRSKANATGTMR